MITRSIRFRMALWYAALLTGALVLFGAASYIGLERYLQKSLEELEARKSEENRRIEEEMERLVNEHEVESCVAGPGDRGRAANGLL